eukprot:jgi/Tetstr1/455029/TSEL_041885.t1
MVLLMLKAKLQVPVPALVTGRLRHSPSNGGSERFNHTIEGQRIPTEGPLKGHQCKGCGMLYHNICTGNTGGTAEGYCSEQCFSIGLSWQGDFFAPALQDPAEQPHDNAVARRFGPAPEVGDAVQVAVPGVDRGKVDATTCTLVIIEVTAKGMYRLANLAGVVNRCYGQSDLAPMSNSKRRIPHAKESWTAAKGIPEQVTKKIRPDDRPDLRGLVRDAGRL